MFAAEARTFAKQTVTDAQAGVSLLTLHRRSLGGAEAILWGSKVLQLR